MSSSFDPRLLADFARYYGFHYGVCDPQALVKDLVIEMERGLTGDESTLPMIPSWIKPLSSVPHGRTVLALDAGGTNMRAALVSFDEQGKAIAHDISKTHMPGTKGRLDRNAFFDEIAALAGPLLEKQAVDGIGFCFSYPMEATEDADGILMSFSKEVDAPDVIGTAVGAELRKALERRGTRYTGKIVLLNDTVSTLLSGQIEIPANGGLIRGEDIYGAGAGPVIGFILGTGMNIAYPETRIPKIGWDRPDESQIIVCETGAFNTRYTGRLDDDFDKTTKNPGHYRFEKTMAGAYLGPLSLVMLKKAIGDGVLDFDRSNDILSMECLQTKDLNQFMHAPLTGEGPLGSLFAKHERDALASFCYLVSIITRRAALFAAATVASAVEKAGAGFDPFAPVRIAVEGTTYMIYKGMRTSLESYLNTMLQTKAPRNIAIAPVEQASLFGAAAAALSKD